MATNIVKVNLESPRTVDSIATLEALNVSKQTGTVYLDAGGRSGWFKWESSDLSTEVSSDTAQGIYVAPSSDATGASGAWVRVFDGDINAGWFGAVGDGSTDDVTALQNAINYVGASGGGTLNGLDKTYVIDSGLLTVNYDDVFFRNFHFLRTDTTNTGWTLQFASTTSTTGGGVKDCIFTGFANSTACAGLLMGDNPHKASRYTIQNVVAKNHAQFGVGIEAGDYWNIDGVTVLDHGLTSGTISSCIGFYIYPKVLSEGGRASNIYSRMSDAARDNASTNAAAVKIQTHQNLQISNVVAIYGREEALSVDSPSGTLSDFHVIAQSGRPAAVFGNNNPAHSFTGQFVMDGFYWEDGTSYIGAAVDGEYKLTGCTLRNFYSKNSFNVLNRTRFKDCLFENFNASDISFSTTVGGLLENSVDSDGNVFRNIVASGGTAGGKTAIQTNNSVLAQIGTSPVSGDTTNGIFLYGDNNIGVSFFVNNTTSNALTINGSSNEINDVTLKDITGRSVFFTSVSEDNIVRGGNLYAGANISDLGSNNRWFNTAQWVSRAVAPTSGTWQRGDIAWENAPTSGKNVGWICTSSGTPGTWVEFGITNKTTDSLTVTTGDLTLNSGDLVIGTSGNGIDFSANTDDAAGVFSGSGEILNDYEEGTWTPTLGDSSADLSGSTAYSTQTGRYIKIGNMVYASCSITLSALDTTGFSGGELLYVRGLPFSIAAVGVEITGSLGAQTGFAAGNAPTYVSPSGGTTRAFLRSQYESSGTFNGLTISDLTSSSRIAEVGIVYSV